MLPGFEDVTNVVHHLGAAVDVAEDAAVAGLAVEEVEEVSDGLHGQRLAGAFPLS